MAQNYQQAIAWFKKAAHQGDAGAQNSLGTMYKNGQGMAQNYQQALMWFQKAANQGSAAAQFNLGAMYYQGQGMAQDYQQAKVWWQKVLAQPDTANNTEAKAVARAGLQQLEAMGIH